MAKKEIAAPVATTTVTEVVTEVVTPVAVVVKKQNPQNIKISILKKYMRTREVLQSVQVDPKASAQATTAQTASRNKIIAELNAIITTLTGVATTQEIAILNDPANVNVA